MDNISFFDQKKSTQQVECFFIYDKLYINSNNLSSEENEW